MRHFLAARVSGGARPLIWGGDLNVAAAWEDVGPDPTWFRDQNGRGFQPDDCGQPGFTRAEQTRFAQLLQAPPFIISATRHLPSSPPCVSPHHLPGSGASRRATFSTRAASRTLTPTGGAT